MGRTSKQKLLIVILSLIMIIAGCKFAFDSQKSTVIRIMAAASLTEVFNELQQGFEEKYPDIRVEANYAGSQAVTNQIKSGVEADVFAPANIKYMIELQKEEMVVNPQIFAYNKLIIGVFHQLDSINSLEDLIKPNVNLAIAAPSVPVGQYTFEMLSKIETESELDEDYRQKFLKNITSKELNVKSIATKVELGEVDAGIIYRTDITPENKDKIKCVKISDKYNAAATYSVAVLEDSEHQVESKKFLNYLFSQEGGKILQKYGFVTEGR